MIDTATTGLRALVERLESLAERRLALHPRSEAAAARARQLADHLRGHVRVRAASLDAPLVVLLVGPTGAGKSTIFNTIAGRAAARPASSDRRPASPSSWSIRTTGGARRRRSRRFDPTSSVS